MGVGSRQWGSMCANYLESGHQSIIGIKYQLSRAVSVCRHAGGGWGGDLQSDADGRDQPQMWSLALQALSEGQVGWGQHPSSLCPLSTSKCVAAASDNV